MRIYAIMSSDLYSQKIDFGKIDTVVMCIIVIMLSLTDDGGRDDKFY